jgi:hypothetical protein
MSVTATCRCPVSTRILCERVMNIQLGVPPPSKKWEINFNDYDSISFTHGGHLSYGIKAMQSAESQSTFRKYIPSPSSTSMKKPSGKQNSFWLFMLYFSISKTEVTCYSETSIDFQRTTRRYIPETELFISTVRTSNFTWLNTNLLQRNWWQ